MLCFSTCVRSLMSILNRGASPLGLPCTRSRAPLRRRAPLAWLARGARSRSLSGMVSPFRVAFQLVGIEVDLAQVARRVAFGLIVEMLRRRIAALPACGHRAGAHAVGAELDDGNEAVAARAVHPLRARIGARAERRQRTPRRRRKSHRNARLTVVELLDDAAVVALEAVDLAPRRLPRAEIGREAIGRRRKILH